MRPVVWCWMSDLPGRSGLDFQRELAESGIHLPIVFITGHGDIPMSARSIKAGAIEFLTKPFHDQELLDAIPLGIERDRSRRRDAAAMAALHEHFSSLAPREREIMALVVGGRMNKQIAGDLGVSEITVKVHRGHRTADGTARPGIRSTLEPRCRAQPGPPRNCGERNDQAPGPELCPLAPTSRGP